MSGRRVLLVEDEVLVRELLAEVLSEAGYRVVEAGTGDEAAALIEAHGAARDGHGGFDVLLTGIATPGRLDGVAVARRARGLRPDVPVVFVSGRPDQGAWTRRLGQPCLFIPKPFRLSSVLDAVRRVAARG